MRDIGLPAAWAPRLLSVLRIVAALLFIEHGTSKWFDFPPFPMDRAMVPMWQLAGILEIGGGLLLLLGLLTRPVAFVLAGEMAFAYWMGHAPRGPFPANNGGDAAILYCFVFLYFSAVGAGPWSVDAATRKRSPAAA